MKSAIVFLLYFAEMLIWITDLRSYSRTCVTTDIGAAEHQCWLDYLLFELVLQPLESYRKSLASSIIEKMENR